MNKLSCTYTKGEDTLYGSIGLRAQPISQSNTDYTRQPYIIKC